MPLAAAPRAKYVFLFIGDGMAMPQIHAAEIYAKARESKDIGIKKLSFTQFPAAGLTTTYDAGSFITDSASAGTAIATGNKTLSGVVNMDPGKTMKYRTIAEMARDGGMKVGIVTSVSLDHATPACFYAKAPSRGDYYDIALQMAQSGFDYFAGGGLLQPRGKKADQPDAIEAAKKAGYSYVSGADAFRALKKGSGKVIAVNESLQDASALYYDMDRAKGELALSDLTRTGIELLSDSKKGFFMVIEGGKIDWSCHANDAGATIAEVLALDAAIQEALAFAAKYPKDTLIVVTGDHETGGMTIGYAGTKYSTFYDKIARQSFSFQRFNDEVFLPYKRTTTPENAKLEDMLPALESCFGLDYESLMPAQKEELKIAFFNSINKEMTLAATQDQYLLYGGYEPFTVKVTQIMNQNAGIGWTSYSHTGLPVTTFASGTGQELFSGYYDNTDIFKKLCQIMGLKPTK